MIYLKSAFFNLQFQLSQKAPEDQVLKRLREMSFLMAKVKGLAKSGRSVLDPEFNKLSARLREILKEVKIEGEFLKGDNKALLVSLTLIDLLIENTFNPITAQTSEEMALRAKVTLEALAESTSLLHLPMI